MGQKHLHELLKEDQEPFKLKTFISDHRSKLKSTTNVSAAGKTDIIVKKQKPIIKPTGRNFCINHVCLFTSADSPEFRNSPFLDFPTRELKSPCNSNNNNATVFLNIPAMLLEAAARVHKPEPGTKFKFGLFGSFLRRLKDRSIRTKRCEIGPVNGTILSSPATGRTKNKKKSVNGGVKLSENSSDILSEMDVSCTLRSVHEFEEIDCLCSNPSSPFRFSLHQSPSPTRRKFHSSSPPASPNRHFRQDKESYEVECTEEVNRENDDEKEQCSPVSVLDPVFVDDEEGRDGGATEEDGYDIECCYANVQRAKHQLLQKLKRFERLAGLDPIDLESRMFDQCSNEDGDFLTNEEEVTNEEWFREIVKSLGVGKIPWYMKKLVLDLIEEENKNGEDDMIVERVCKRLHLWKVVDLNTIDMIVETDFISEGWKCCDKETIRDMGADIEMEIFGFLMEELAQELVL